MNGPHFNGLVQPPVADGGAGNLVARLAIRANIHDAIDNGRFLPFLGAGASASGPDSGVTRPELWGPARDRAAVLLMGGDAAVASYIRVLCDTHGLIIDGHAAASKNDRHEALLSALASLAVHLGRVFGRQLGLTPSPLEASPRCRVDIPDAERQAVTEHALEVLNAARSFWQGVVAAHGDEADWLDGYGMYRSIQALTTMLVDRQCWAASSLGRNPNQHPGLLQMREDMQDLLGEQNEPPGYFLHLELLEWLAGAVWHVLRSEVSAYPTSDELSFRIGLGATADCLLRRVPLVEAASAYEHRALLAERITSWLAAPEAETNSQPTDLHLALAASLKVGFDRYRERDYSGHVPVAFTTNYDRCLEMALRAIGSDYHLVCPAIVPAPRDDAALAGGDAPISGEPVRPVWLTTKVVVANANAARKWQIMNASPDSRDAMCGQDGKEIRLVGPVVVKLHGSPLEQLPEPYTHFIVLNEATYLETMTGNLKQSEWIEHQLTRDNRDLWFVGYSIGDWDVRATLYQQATTSKEAHYRGAINRTVNSSQNALLSSMGVRPVCIRLPEVVEMIGSEDHVKRIFDPVLRRLGR